MLIVLGNAGTAIRSGVVLAGDVQDLAGGDVAVGDPRDRFQVRPVPVLEGGGRVDQAGGERSFVLGLADPAVVI